MCTKCTQFEPDGVQSLAVGLLRDPAWQFVGAAVAVLALLLSLLIAIIQRQRKRLDYQIITDTPLHGPRGSEGQATSPFRRRPN